MAINGRGALFFFFVLVVVFSLATWAQEPQQQGPKIDWQVGPTTGHLGDIADINIPEGYQFAGKQGAQTALRITHNIPSGKELGVLVPSSNTANWFMIFEFVETGYVKDTEKDSLDADAVLKSIKNGTEAANEERQKQG